MTRATLYLLALTVLLGACAKAPLASVPVAEREAIAGRMTQDIAILASDEFAGRKPGTPGGQRTVEYLVQRFEQVGLTSGTNDPGNPWRAPVQLTSARASQSDVELIVEGKPLTLTEEEAVAVTTRRRELISEADLVFVGFEAQRISKERVMGKAVIMLAGSGLNPERRILLEQKQASAVIVVAPNPDIVARIRRESSVERTELEGEIDEAFAVVATRAAMVRAFGGERWEALVQSALGEGFEPVDLPAKVNIEARSERRDFTSYNVLGRLAGTSPDTQAILLMAHWDHLGLCRPESAKDRICNGAVDNASGIALMLELGRRLAARGPFERDIYILATSAEEDGLLGAKAFADAPPIPLQSVIAAFNFDSVALAKAGSPLGFVGEGRTPLDTFILETLIEADRDLGNREYAESFVKRQDAWALLQKGVPAVMLSSAFASEITAGPFFEGDYHSPSDEAEGVELGGAIDDLLLHEELVARLAVPATEQVQARK
ncbi:MAG: M28 family peptidase [Pseudomonadota bacterium]